MPPRGHLFHLAYMRSTRSSAAADRTEPLHRCEHDAIRCGRNTRAPRTSRLQMRDLACVGSRGRIFVAIRVLRGIAPSIFGLRAMRRAARPAPLLDRFAPLLELLFSARADGRAIAAVSRSFPKLGGCADRRSRFGSHGSCAPWRCVRYVRVVLIVASPAK